MTTDQALTLTEVKEYIWTRYIENEDVEHEIDENAILDFFREHYRRVPIENDDDSFYFGVLMFEKAWEEPERKEEYFFLAREVLRIYRDHTGETDWDAVEDRLTDIADFLEELGVPEEELARRYALPAPPVEEKDVLETLREAAPEGMVLVPLTTVHVPGRDEPVEVEPFFIDRFPVTVGEFQRFLDTTQYRAPKYWGEAGFKEKDQPVVGISFMDAEKYADWAGKQIPTHEQWIAAARGGTQNPYPWGDEMDPQAVNGKMSDDQEPNLSAVGHHPGGASPCGVEDLLGGAWEWTDSWYDAGMEYKIIKGGSYVDPPSLLSIETILYASPKEKIDNIGFRCCRPVEGVR